MNLYPKKLYSTGVWGVKYVTQLSKTPTSVTIEFKVTRWKVYCWAAWQCIKSHFKK